MSSLTHPYRTSAPTRGRHGLAGRFALVVATAGFALSVAAFYPGFLSDDAVHQFGQSLAFRFQDWHPPMMAVWWSVLDHVRAGPEPMLLLQVAAYWLAAFWLLETVPTASPRILRWSIVAALFSPAVLNFIGVVEKDVQLGACWILVSAGCYRRRAAGTEPTRLEKALLLLLVSYGALLRQNSALVAAPLVLYVLTGRATAATLWRTVALYGLVALAYLALGAGLNAAVHAEQTHVLRGLLNFDLAGISLRTGENVFPFPLSPAEMERISTCYEGGVRHDNLVWGECSFVWRKGLASPLTDAGYLETWLSAVFHHPLAYVLHRLTFFAKFSGLMTLQPTHAFWLDGTRPNDLGFSSDRHPLFYAVKFYTYAALATPLLRVGFWFAAALALLLWVRRRPGCSDVVRRFASMTAILSAAYILTYLPFGLAPEFRYIYAAILLTTFGWCAALAGMPRRLATAGGSTPDRP